MINLIPEKYPSSPIKTSEVNRVKVSGTQSQELLPSGTLKVKIYYLLTVMYFLCFVTWEIKLWKICISLRFMGGLSKRHRFLCGFFKRQMREFLENEAKAASQQFCLEECKCWSQG
jgi:hypothetical protein